MPRWASVVEQLPEVGGPTYAGEVTPLVVPEWTDATDWAAVARSAGCSRHLCWPSLRHPARDFVAGQETNYAVFMNDQHRIKVRHFLAIWVNDYRPLVKSNVSDGGG